MMLEIVSEILKIDDVLPLNQTFRPGSGICRTGQDSVRSDDFGVIGDSAPSPPVVNAKGFETLAVLESKALCGEAEASRRTDAEPVLLNCDADRLKFPFAEK
jgi:hypothetical protein